MTGLINYMGKIDLPLDGTDVQRNDPDQGKGIAIRPVLLRKGNTRLGLYGVGNVKDARMHFELRSNRVRMYMPRDKDSWFNILLLHQNRSVKTMVILTSMYSSLSEGLRTDPSNLCPKACSMTASTWWSGVTNTTVASFRNL